MATERIADLLVRLRLDAGGLERGLNEAVSDVRRFSSGVEQSMRRLNTAFRATAAAFGVSFGAGAIVSFTRSLLDAVLAAERIERAMKAATGSAQAGAAEYEFVRDTANRLGLSLREVATEYTQLAAAARGTSLEGAEIRRVFEAIASASVVLGLSTEQTKRLITGFTQVVSKGKLTSEELRQQIGEALPGALRMFEEAFKRATGSTADFYKLLEDGKIGLGILPAAADVILEKYGAAVPDAINSTQAALARFDTAIYELKVTIGDAGFVDQLADYIRDLTEYLKRPDTLEAATDFGEALTSGLQMALDVAEATRDAVKFVVDGFQDVADAITKLDQAIEDSPSLRWLTGAPATRRGMMSRVPSDQWQNMTPMPPPLNYTPVDWRSQLQGDRVPADIIVPGGEGASGKSRLEAMARKAAREREQAEKRLTAIIDASVDQRMKAADREADMVGIQATRILAELDNIQKKYPEKEGEIQNARIQVIQAANDEIERIYADTAEKILEEQEEQLQKTLERYQETFEKIGNFIGDTVGGFLLQQERDWAAFFRSLAASLISSGITEVFKELGTAAGTAAAGKPAGAGGWLGKIASFAGFFFAEGGLVSRPTIGVIGESGPEVVIPLDRLAAMRSATQVNVYSTTPGVEVERRPLGGGREVVDVFVGGAMARNMQRGFGRQRHAPGAVGG